MNITIDKQDINEIENKYDDLGQWLISNFASFPACAFVLQSVMSAVDEFKKTMDEFKETVKEE